MHEWSRVCYHNRTPDQSQPKISCDHCTEDEHLPYESLFPDYLNDLNAMYEAENKTDLIRNNSQEYIQQLQHFRGIHWGFCTAQERAEAFLHTLNLWDDTK